MIQIENLKPFPKFCYTIGMIPSSYKESLTYEEQLIWFCNFLENTVIPAVNNNGLAVEELQNLFVELTNYVNNYFDNLDIQQEIDDKLDEMADNGELAEIIAQYVALGALINYGTVAELKTAENLTNGTFVKTAGYYAYNDNGGAMYKVRTKTNDDTADEMLLIALHDNTLIAELINQKDKIDIRQLGAKTVASFDNKNIIQKAVDNFNTVIVSNGTYYVSNVITLNSNNIIEGNKGKLTSDSPYIFTGNEISNVLIKNIELESTVDTTDTINMRENQLDDRGYSTLSSIVYIHDSENITIENSVIHGGFMGIYIPLSKNVVVQNCECYESSSKIVCLSTSNFKLLNNYIHDVKVVEGQHYSCYLFQASDYSGSGEELSIIANNSFENNDVWDAIMMHDYNKIVISNNTIKNVRQGIDLSLIPSTETKPSGNIIISNNYMEGTDTNTWGETQGQCHGIYVSGNAYQEPIIISNNIISNFGKFLSGTSGSALCLSGAKNVNVSGNYISITESSTSLKAGIFLSGDCDNLNISNNIISSNDLTAIYLYSLILDSLIIKDNNLITTADYAIRTNGGCAITELLLDNTCPNPVNEFCVNNGDSINKKSYSVAWLRAQFNKTYRFEYSINTFTVPANSTVTKDVTKTNLGFTGTLSDRGIYLVNVPNGIPASCIIKANYKNSTTITLTFINASSSQITVPTVAYTIDYKY